MVKDIKPKYKTTKIKIKKPIRINKVRFNKKGISKWNKDSLETPTGYCLDIELLDNGHLQVWTDGKYRFLNKKEIKKLIKILNKRIKSF